MTLACLSSLCPSTWTKQSCVNLREPLISHSSQCPGPFVLFSSFMMFYLPPSIEKSRVTKICGLKNTWPSSWRILIVFNSRYCLWNIILTRLHSDALDSNTEAVLVQWSKNAMKSTWSLLLTGFFGWFYCEVVCKEVQGKLYLKELQIPSVCPDAHFYRAVSHTYWIAKQILPVINFVCFQRQETSGYV